MLEKWDGAVPKVSGSDASLLLDVSGAAGTGTAGGAAAQEQPVPEG